MGKFGVLWLLAAVGFVVGSTMGEVAPQVKPSADRREPITNADFETGRDDAPAAWTSDAYQARQCEFKWEEGTGVGGSRCLSIQAAESFNDARWKQTVHLAPRTAYVLRGAVKGESIALEKDARIGANLCILGVWGCASDVSKSTGSFDWRPLQVDFATGESADVELACRLGHWSSLAKGKAYFDNLRLEPNPEVVRTEGKHVYLNLYREDLTAITPEHYRRWLASLDRVYEAMADLVGREPFGGAKIGVYSSQWYPGGWAVAGNPIIWAKPYVKESLAACDASADWCFGILHEIGHDFDEDGAWNFNGEFFANFKLHYVVETLNGKVTHGKQYTGRDLVNFWKADADQSYEKAWRNADPKRRAVPHDGLQYKMLVIQQKVGWEPFKKTFRYFHALPADQRPRTDWAKFQAFHDQLSRFSGFDAWSVYTAEELKLLKAQYR
ncbi:MAG: M60 family metallopeptidase [Pirellulales bacterium]